MSDEGLAEKLICSPVSKVHRLKAHICGVVQFSRGAQQKYPHRLTSLFDCCVFG